MSPARVYRPEVQALLDAKDTKGLLKLAMFGPERTVRSEAASAQRALRAHRPKPDPVEPAATQEGVSEESFSLAPYSSAEPEPMLGASRRARIYKGSARGLELATKATTIKVYCDSCHKRLGAPVEQPDWTARLRAHDLLFTLLGSYPARTVAAPVKPKLVEATEPEWKRKLRPQVSP